MKTSLYLRSFAAVCIFALSYGSGLAQITYKIVGTGVNLCYGNTNPITCPTNPSDPFYGQFQGTAPSYQDNGDGTVTDLNTGLMWISARGSKISWDSAFIKAAVCTTGGHNDWRVPTIKELYSLISFSGRSAPTVANCIAYIDTAYFGWTTGDTTIGERVIDAQDWSATRYTSLTMMADTTIFGVNFVDGRIKGYPKYQPPTNTIPQKMYVRYVRGNTAYGHNSFVDNGDSTITDHATGLMWAKYDAGAGMNWQSALAYAQTRNVQNYLGHNDWRLPHSKELHSIVDYSRSLDATASAAIDPVFNCTAITNEGGTTDYPFFWTSTTHLDNMGGVYISFGEALGYMKMPPSATYYTLKDVHGAGAQRSDPKAGSVSNYYLGLNQAGDSVYGLGPQGDVIRISNFVRLVRDADTSAGFNEIDSKKTFAAYPNPANEIIHIECNWDISAIGLFDIQGRSLYTASDVRDIDVRQIPGGIYFICVTDLKGNNVYQKVLISR